MAYTTIDDPTQYFDTTLWTGSGGARTISGLNHKPDLIWTKTRSVGYNHMWSDSSRGFNANSELGSNSTAAEGGLSAETYGYKSGHTADGWTMVDGTDSVDNQEDGNTNQPSVTYVGWTWAANGGTTTTNDASSTGVGNVDSVYQANTTAGFSIVTFDLTSDSGDKTIAHGLGVAPKVIIFKNRDAATNWAIYHHTQTPPKYLTFTTDPVYSSDDFNNSTAPTSTVFSLATSWHGANKHVAYCFAEKQGYSKFGSYTGNGNDDGPFVYTGFKPAWLMLKRTDNARPWFMFDNKRNPSNVMKIRLKADSSAADDTSNDNRIDFLSNGFKIRDDALEMAADGGTYIYMAFAESPFVSSEGVPTTAR